MAPVTVETETKSPISEAVVAGNDFSVENTGVVGDGKLLKGGSPEARVVETSDPDAEMRQAYVDIEAERERKKGWFAYIKTRHFWIVLVLG